MRINQTVANSFKQSTIEKNQHQFLNIKNLKESMKKEKEPIQTKKNNFFDKQEL